MTKSVEFIKKIMKNITSDNKSIFNQYETSWDFYGIDDSSIYFEVKDNSFKFKSLPKYNYPFLVHSKKYFKFTKTVTLFITFKLKKQPLVKYLSGFNLKIIAKDSENHKKMINIPLAFVEKSEEDDFYFYKICLSKLITNLKFDCIDFAIAIGIKPKQIKKLEIFDILIYEKNKEKLHNDLKVENNSFKVINDGAKLSQKNNIAYL